MAPTHQESATDRLLTAFASRLESLDAPAWDRIASRCAALDVPTVAAFFGRAGLLAESATPDADPYRHPLLKPAMAALGTVVGILNELTLTRAESPDRLRRAAERQRAADKPVPGLAPYLEIEGIAQRQLPRHPGVASALRAVFMALVVGPMMSPQRLATIYSPFEPEIPYSSLGTPAGEHAA